MKQRFKWFIALISLPLLILAALHTHPLWSSASLPASNALQSTAPLARITRTPAAIIETGMEMDDLINSMVFDPDGILWLSSIEGGVYLYSIPTNEVVHLLFQEYVYGLFSEEEGVWVLTSRAAYLYRNQIHLRTIDMPEGVIPLCGVSAGAHIFLGTTEGLYRANKTGQHAVHAAFNNRIHQMKADGDRIFMATDNGVYCWNAGRFIDLNLHDLESEKQVFVAISTIYGVRIAASDQYGLLVMQRDKWKRIRFAKSVLNLYSAGAATEYNGSAWFGTGGGFLVRYRKGKWSVFDAGDGPVSALAANHTAIYAWSGGKLLRVIADL
jgi:ligand-binding sensor domain-containing protein